jgi:uncharacterized protein
MTWLWALIGICLLAAVWGIGIERHLRVVRYEDQSIDVLPVGSEPIRVLHISDFHLAPWQKRKLAWISRLGNLNIDLVIDTGDNLGHAQAIAPTLAALSPLGSKPGVFVNGSNDYYAPKARNPLSYLAAPSERQSQVRLDTKTLTDGFESWGWLNLNNAGGTLIIKGTRIGFVGIDDFHDGLSDLPSISQNKTVLEAQSEPQLFIGVTHAPYLAVIDAMNDAGIPLLFGGHTHGGQVCIPGYGAIVTNCDLPTKAAKGLSSWSRGGNQLWLNVCAGLGHSIFAPVRFACRPEVRVLTLVAKKA